MKFSELKSKEIVNVSSGKKLGYADDVILDVKTYKIVALLVQKSTKMFKKLEYIEIPISSIVKIGENVILVDFIEGGSSIGSKNEETKFIYTPKVFKRSTGVR